MWKHQVLLFHELWVNWVAEMSHLFHFLSAQCHHLVTTFLFLTRLLFVPFGHFYILHYWIVFRILLHFHPYLAYYFYDMKNTQHALPASPCFLFVFTVLCHTFRDLLPHLNFLLKSIA